MSFSEKICFLDAFDDAMFSFALKDIFPRVVFHGELIDRDSTVGVSRETIPECPGYSVRIFFPKEGWEPELEPSRSHNAPQIVTNLPEPLLTHRRATWFWGHPGGSMKNWAFSLPTMNFSQLNILYDKEIEDHKKIIKLVWKALRSISTNKIKAGIQKNDFVRTSEVKGSGGPWAGFHALDWCRREPNRMLGGTYRTCDDWEWPDDPYIQELQQRVIKRFGPNLGKEPPEPSPKDDITGVLDRCWEGMTLPHFTKA